eukprot:sb/3465030/
MGVFCCVSDFLKTIGGSFDNVNYMYCSLAFVSAEFLFDTYLIWRQRRIVKDTESPTEDVKKLMDNETYSKARWYSLEKINFGIIHDFYSYFETLAVSLLFITPFFWEVAGKSIEYFGYSHELIQSNAFLWQSSIIMAVIHLPWSLYRTFVIEERHGFNKMTLGFYFKDTLKKIVLSNVISSLIMTPLIYLIQWGGDYFFIYAWALVFVFTMAVFFIYMDFIAPMFDTYTPVPESPLKTAIEELASSINFPLTKLYIVDGSKRSNHSNAFFYGFFKNKRIVLFDTLLDETCNPLLGLDENGNKKQFPSGEEEESEEKKKKGCTQEEVVAVLGHELGHWYLGHVYKPLLINQAVILGMFYLFGVLVKNEQMLADFGFPHGSQPTLMSLTIIFQYMFGPINKVFSILSTQLTRRFEFQADAFA